MAGSQRERLAAASSFSRIHSAMGLPARSAASRTLKCLYLVTRSLDPTGRGRARWAIRGKPAINALAITFESRIVASTSN